MNTTKQGAKGIVEEVKGRVKEGVGAGTDDARLEREGRAQKKVGQARQEVARSVDRLRGAAKDRDRTDDEL